MYNIKSVFISYNKPRPSAHDPRGEGEFKMTIQELILGPVKTGQCTTMSVGIFEWLLRYFASRLRRWRTLKIQLKFHPLLRHRHHFDWSAF